MYDSYDINTRVYLIYCDIGNYRHWVKEATSSDKFFENYDKLCSALSELCKIEYEYHEPTPSAELKELQDNEQDYIRRFLTRAWINKVSKAAKLKTERGRNNTIKSFFAEIEPYKKRFDDKTIELLEKAHNAPLNYSLKKQSKEDKDLVFVTDTEKRIEQHANSILNNDLPADILYLYCHEHLLRDLVGYEIQPEIMFDIIGLVLIGYDYKKAARFISIKYNIPRNTTTELFLTASGIVSSHRDLSSRSLLFADSQYKIIVHGEPCEICIKYQGKTFAFSDAKIGYNYPPICSHGCSTAVIINK